MVLTTCKQLLSSGADQLKLGLCELLGKLSSKSFTANLQVLLLLLIHWYFCHFCSKIFLFDISFVQIVEDKMESLISQVLALWLFLNLEMFG